MSPPPEGRLLGGRYTVGDTIGIGGMAEVFLGLDTRLGRPVAVKVLRADLARDPTFQERFRREASSAASLNAPSIVAVYDTGEDTVDGTAGVPWIVMEHISGRTLRQVLLTEGPLLPVRALEIVAEVCDALEVAHTAGIVHRDIKPANVMLTPEAEVKVMDFGIARAAAGGSQTVTQTANVLGTAAYLSPEQARGEHVDARSDLYSAGCLLYELLVGRPPFSGDSPVSVAYQHVREDPVPPSQLDDRIEPEIDAVVLTAMAKHPDDRYQTAGQMRDDLLRAAAGEQVQARPSLTGAATVLPGGSVRLPAPERRRRAGAYALFALLLLAVAAGVGLAVRHALDNNNPVVAVPYVIGLDQQDAQGVLARAGLDVGQLTQVFGDRPLGQVVDQSPSSGSPVDRGRRVDLVVSKGVQVTLVPQIVGQSQAEAQAELAQAGLTVAEVVPRGGNLAPDQVLEVMPPAGTQLPTGSKVTLVVANGLVGVPVVVRLTEDQAIAQLKAAGLSVGVQLQSDPGPPGVVLSQDPQGTTVPRLTTVTIVVSRTPDPPAPTTPAPTTPAPTTPAPTPTGTSSPTPTPPPTSSSPTP